MIYDHPRYGQFKVELNSYPSISINHYAGMKSAEWYAKGVEQNFAKIAQDRTFTATSLTEHTINNVPYTLSAVIEAWHSMDEFKVRWTGTMTPKARQKLKNDTELSDALMAFVVEHDAELRQEVVDRYRAQVTEVVANLRGNADAIEQAAGQPEPSPPAERHARFITDLMNSMRDTLLGKVARFPEDWDGYELRELIKDYVAENAPVGTGMNRSRKAAYDNEVLVRNLT